jgi:hypothetical protein
MPVFYYQSYVDCNANHTDATEQRAKNDETRGRGNKQPPKEWTNPRQGQNGGDRHGHARYGEYARNNLCHRNTHIESANTPMRTKDVL